MNLNYENILLKHGKSVLNSRSEADISARLGNHTFKVPVVCANMPAVQSWDILRQFDANGWFYIYHRLNGPDDVFRFAQSGNEEFNITSISVGIKPEWIEMIKDLSADKVKVDYFTVDVALSYNGNILPVLRQIKESFPNAYVVVGNGCTGEWASWLASTKLCDCIKVGIGVSKACQTRQFTGFGSSTISSVAECSDQIAQCNYYTGFGRTAKVMSDGGITVNKDGIPFIGDITKALVVGKADWVMSGALFKHCADSPSVTHGYYGNASTHGKGHDKHVEGRNVTVHSNGYTVKQVMDLIEDSLRSSVSYSGGRNIEEMKKLTKWEIV